MRGRRRGRGALAAAWLLLPLGGEARPEPPPPPPATATLEDAARDGSTSDFLARARADASAKPTSLAELETALRPYLRVYRPEGTGPFPATVFLHGCSGPTRSHEEDWARFHRDRGVVLIAVDSLAPRDLDGRGVCDLEVLTGRERAADVLTILAHARGLPFVDRDRLALMGFSHGAWTIWELFVLASHQRPPLGLAQWPEGGLDGVRAAFLFYGPCLETWTVRIPTLAFLASADRYIDEKACIGYAQRQEAKREADAAPFFSYRLFEGATHTFDHARPNAANREAGSIYDPRATRAAQDEIERRMDAFLQPAGRGKTGSVRTGSVGRHAASPLP